MSTISTAHVLLLVAGIATLVLVTGILYLAHLIWVTHQHLEQTQRKNARGKK